MTPVKEGQTESRGNAAWIAALRGDSADGAEAVAELEVYLHRVLFSVGGGRLGTEAVGELVQDTMVRIVESLDRFRGDSAFTTWAAGIGTRVLFTELRRRRTRERRRDPFDEALADAREPGAPAPDAAASRNELLAALERAIAQSLSERQRTAILAELRGVPTVEIAERLGTNPNALYKLTHDARRKLRRALVHEGFGAESLRGGSEDGR